MKVKNSGFHPSVAYLILFNLSLKTRTRQFGKATFLLKIKPRNPRWRKSSRMCGNNKNRRNLGAQGSFKRVFLFNPFFRNILGQDNLEKQLSYWRSQGTHGGGRAAGCAVTTKKWGKSRCPKELQESIFIQFVFKDILGQDNLEKQLSYWRSQGTQPMVEEEQPGVR